jgi:c-di-GMP-binding flagellar brake protein YcgR
MSYLSKGKWHVAKLLLKEMGAHRLSVQVVQDAKPYPVNIRIGQPVGVSIKYRYGKVVFDTLVEDFEQQGREPARIVLTIPDRVEIIERRSYFRVNVPASLKVNVTLWHRSHLGDERKPPENYWQGKLVDISAGGLQAVVDNSLNPDFTKGQFITLRFTPLPYEQPIMFSAQIRNTLSTANSDGVCLGMQIVGLEASPEGRQTLRRLCNVVEQYYQANQSSAKQQDLKAVN